MIGVPWHWVGPWGWCVSWVCRKASEVYARVPNRLREYLSNSAFFFNLRCKSSFRAAKWMLQPPFQSYTVPLSAEPAKKKKTESAIWRRNQSKCMLYHFGTSERHFSALARFGARQAGGGGGSKEGDHPTIYIHTVVERFLRQDPLDLSFWSFLTFFHHGIEEVERHLLWKFYKNNRRKSWSNVRPKLVACIGFLYKVVHKIGRLRKFNRSRVI